MKAILAAGMFLLVGVVSVLACSADYWPAGPDFFSGGNCGGVPTVNNAKSSYWSVKYPLQTDYTSVTSYGTGQCCAAIPSLCWPIFFSPNTLTDNLWKQVVDSQRINDLQTHCTFFSEITFPTPGGLPPAAGYCPSPEARQYNDCNDTVDNDQDGYTDYDDEGCLTSPIVLDVAGNGFHLTGLSDPVTFDFDGNGRPLTMGWTAAGQADAFLVLDRNGNGTIDNGMELFGNLTPQTAASNRNGFLALAEYDNPENGGNGDGVIDGSDVIFSSLKLWQDMNHNGVSEPNELHTLPELGVESLSLDFRQSRRVDRYGNRFNFRTKVYGPGYQDNGHWAYDVFLVFQH